MQKRLARSGNIPVISSSGQKNKYLGFISKKWLEQNAHPIYTRPLITVNADGSVGDVFIRQEPEYTMIDVVNSVDVLDPHLDQIFVMYAIKEAIAKNFNKYNAKLYAKRLKELTIKVPVKEKGEFDEEQQKLEAAKLERLDEIKQTLIRFGKEIEDKFITTE